MAKIHRLTWNYAVLSVRKGMFRCLKDWIFWRTDNIFSSLINLSQSSSLEINAAQIPIRWLVSYTKPWDGDLYPKVCQCWILHPGPPAALSIRFMLICWSHNYSFMVLLPQVITSIHTTMKGKFLWLTSCNSLFPETDPVPQTALKLVAASKQSSLKIHSFVNEHSGQNPVCLCNPSRVL